MGAESPGRLLEAAPGSNGQGAASGVPHVQLGEHSYAIYPQRHAYLSNKLGKWIGDLQNLGGVAESADVSDLLMVLGPQAYGFFKVFIPKLMPEYEFRGFANQGALEAGEYDEDYDQSPSFPELVDAFQTCLTVNRLDLLGHLGKVFRTDLMKAYLNRWLAERMESTLLSSSSSESTESASMSSGTTPPISGESSDSPSPDSTT